MSQIPCPRCGEMIDSQAVKCPYCRSFIRNNNANFNQYGGGSGYSGGSPFEMNELFADSPEGISRGLAALFAFLFGTFGAQYFYMGKTKAGLICLLITVCTCGSIPSILGVIQAIIMLTMTNEAWRQRYCLTSSVFPF